MDKTGKGALRYVVGGLLCASCLFPSTTGKCVDSKVASRCMEDKECHELGERHLYCNKTNGANACAFGVETYVGSAFADRDCPGEEFSAEPWSNPVHFAANGSGVDCIRWCYNTPSCFAAVVYEHNCFLKNDNCFVNMNHVPGAILGVMSVVREDYRCGCSLPFLRQRANGQLLSWTPSCPESQLDRNPYRCCSSKGLCVKCEDLNTPAGPTTVRN